ncbi:uncharacterized protein LOC124196342 isoform X2 [Daphnia pulex]|uniref:uncharacterized protein LOC124196342 isoform X2 n=1 Tax=Daphnia pulex TaxID=6669 RepID=UPI001EE09CA9|nr:uncharacterized protein LOC124196342 isoform X2 [Daphnia pulex]
MSLAIFVSPKLVRILDPNSNPIDVWVVEFPFWLAKYLCEQKAQNESDQQVNEDCPSEYHSSDYISDANEENFEYQSVPDVVQHEPLQNCHFELEKDTLAMSPVNYVYNLNAGYVMQSPHMALFQQDTAMCVHANLAPSNSYCTKSLPFHPQTTHLNEHQHWPVPQIPETSYEIYPESLPFNQPESYDPHSYFPDTPFLPVGIHGGDEFQGLPLHSDNDSMPENFMMYTAENGSFLIENKLSEISAFAYKNLPDWGFSHPLGHVLKNKRGLFGCFTLHSGNACYVKFTPYSIKFSSNQRGVAYVIDEAGVRTCWESFKSFEELISERDDKWEKIDQPQVILQRPCGCGASSCFHHMSSKEMWNSKSEEGENIRIERNGLRFYSETSELKSLNLDLETYHLSSTLRHVGEQDGHIYVKSWHYRFNQSVLFNGKSLQVKFHTQTARLDSNGKLSLSDH